MLWRQREENHGSLLAVCLTKKYEHPVQGETPLHMIKAEIDGRHLVMPSLDSYFCAGTCILSHTHVYNINTHITHTFTHKSSFQKTTNKKTHQNSRKIFIILKNEVQKVSSLRVGIWGSSLYVKTERHMWQGIPSSFSRPVTSVSVPLY